MPSKKVLRLWGFYGISSDQLMVQILFLHHMKHWSLTEIKTRIPSLSHEWWSAKVTRGWVSKMAKSQYLSLYKGYIHPHSSDSRSASSSLNSQVSVFEFEESQSIPGEEVSANLPVVSAGQCACLRPGQEYPISAKCRISPETLVAAQVVQHHSVAESIRSPCTMGPCIVVLEDGALAHLTEIRYNMWSKNFISVPTTSQVTRHDDKGSSAVATDTCLHHNTAAVVHRCWLDTRL